MSDLFIFSGLFCQADAIVKRLIDDINFKLVTDGDLVADAAALGGMSEKAIIKAFSPKTSIFNKFSHEKERAISWLRLALAQKLAEGQALLVSGMVTQLLSQEISHILKVCIIDDLQKRVEIARNESGLSKSEAEKEIHHSDEERAIWVRDITGNNDPWSSSLYDMIIPADKTGADESVALIKEQLNNAAVEVTEASKKAVQDFLLAAQVETALVTKGHNVLVSAKEGKVTLAINKKVLMVDRLEKDLREIAEPLEGVKSVDVTFGKEYYEADIYRRMDFELPSRVLLVDDEREFVKTLSERLLLRDLGSAVVYDGESALDVVKDDEPEVMILDLKMPGIDGIEVLRRVKSDRPNIEVIILTGHGSEDDRKTCMELGAFAYLNKPVDIDVLSKTLKDAYAKVRNA
ncbi:response regulator [Maridesulfovibrio salexigens]|uniref:Response regulator receiver protein n=1 Tax=Maridesulfovibrio salexigens (strain ATCC 14822 / DSM 2638 / NCIMB 8403 / VKM B-1763) TaxID=526222 RepID=C6C132_MARSD|nr:response regulator [Maridesulfovibrio salexigens]ACS79195.1 response regulator receiver protein [Maridesulfovibrio salexigens DSM 2638]